jgi:sugar lactone lactonase YvrE
MNAAQLSIVRKPALMIATAVAAVFAGPLEYPGSATPVQAQIDPGGSAAPPFSTLDGVAIHPNGEVLVLDALDAGWGLRRYTPSGRLIAQWSEPDVGPGVRGPADGLAVAADGTVLVAKHAACTVSRFTLEGERLAQVRFDQRPCPVGGVTVGPAGEIFTFATTTDPRTDGRVLARLDNELNLLWSRSTEELLADGHASSISDIAVGPDGLVYVGLPGRFAIYRITIDGEPLGFWAVDLPVTHEIEDPVPDALAFDADGTLWVGGRLRQDRPASYSRPWMWHVAADGTRLDDFCPMGDVCNALAGRVITDLDVAADGELVWGAHVLDWDARLEDKPRADYREVVRMAPDGRRLAAWGRWFVGPMWERAWLPLVVDELR